MRVLGHRGASADAPENTLQAFRLAVRMRCDGVELDVRRTADHVLVVHHDPCLPDGRALAGLAASEVPLGIPTLADALDTCAALELVNIELKDLPGEPGFDPDQVLASLVSAMVAEREEHERVIVSSFDVDAVDRVRALDPAIGTALLAMVPPVGSTMTRLVARCAESGHIAIHPHHLGLGTDVVARCHRAGLVVRTWTVDEPERIAELAAMGVDAVITNRPDVALRALGRYG